MSGGELVRFRHECSTSMLQIKHGYTRSSKVCHGLNTICKRFSYDCCTVPSTVCYGLARLNTTFTRFTGHLQGLYIRSRRLLFEFDSIRLKYDIDTVEFTRGVDFMCGCIYGLVWSHTVSRGLVLSHTVSHGLVRSLIRLYTDMASVSVFKSFINHTRLSRIHSNDPSVTRIRPWLVRLYVRFTRMANRISRVFCVRQALVEY